MQYLNRQKITLLSIIIVFFCIGCGGLGERWLKPQKPFALMKAPTPPDYSNPVMWAALPQREDLADVAPYDEEDLQSQAVVDVFFIHPTTYYSNKSWNAPLDDSKTNKTTDKAVLRNQASCFNAAGRIFAPRYRQATLFTFMTEEYTDADAAIDLAYQDVAVAFDYYLKHYNNGRPIIIAGHSQGSYHGLRLLRDYFSGKPLLKKLVAAYIIGIPIPLDAFTRIIPDIPLSTTAEQIGCVITWNTVENDVRPERLYRRLPIAYHTGFESNEGKELACVNPLNWLSTDELAAKELHLGAVIFKIIQTPRPEPGLVWAQCKDGVLNVSTPPRRYRGGLLGRQGDYHRVDYPLFYMDIRYNVIARVKAFVDK